jgi:hypothetical protein
VSEEEQEGVPFVVSPECLGRRVGSYLRTLSH